MKEVDGTKPACKKWLRVLIDAIRVDGLAKDDLLVQKQRDAPKRDQMS